MRNNTIISFILLLFLSAGVFFSCGIKMPADLVLINGKVATVNKNFDLAEAVAVRDEHIIFVGDLTDGRKFIGDQTKIIDCSGMLVLPGLTDAHGHLAEYGKTLEKLDLIGTSSYAEIINIVLEKVKQVEPGEWIFGRGWDQNEWEIKEFPDHAALSAISPDNPVYLTRVDGHAILVNEKAMEVAGIRAKTTQPEGGKIYFRSDGSPLGVFVDNAKKLIEKWVPRFTAEKQREVIELASNRCLELGLTSFHDTGIEPERVDDYKALIDENRLGLRVYAMLSDTVLPDLQDYYLGLKVEGYGGNHLTVRAVKVYADGALGSRGASLLKPYTDRPNEVGLVVTGKEHLFNVARAALATGMQLSTHAIGDRGIRVTLDTIEDALAENPVKDHRFRVEHSQIIDPEDIPRFKALGVIPSVQPPQVVSDMNWTEERVGAERIAGAYAFRDFLDSGCILPCGSDVPVESCDPLEGIYRAVTRQDESGFPPGGWKAENALTIEEAIRGYTIWAAEAAFQEDILGSIEVGKLADFTIIDKDILILNPSEILNATTVYTIVGGSVKYQAQ
ncbi:MAG: amidohydrolase [Candidatus Neomarinimicrobiota bacterium]